MNNDSSLNRADFKLKAPCRNQYEFLSRCLDDLVPIDHKVRLIWDFIWDMDLSVCYSECNSLRGYSGRPSIDPKILLTLWIYSILDGNTSARKLEELCVNHDVYRWICGSVSVNRTSLAEFRSLNPRKFDDLLTQCLAVMVKNDLLSDSDFSQDGTRLKASAGNGSFQREYTLNTLETNIRDYIEQLKQEEKKTSDAYEKRKIAVKQRYAIDREKRVKAALASLENARCEKIQNNKKRRVAVTEEDLKAVRASTTDPEARKMKMGDGGFRPAYNIQFATGLDSRVIYGVDAVNTLDPGTASRMMAQVQDRLRKLNLNEIKNWIADAAYSAKSDVITAALLFPNCNYYAPPKLRKGEDPTKPQKGDCEAIRKWREKIGAKETNELYRKRCSTAEFSNMQVKNHGLKEFLVRGLAKVKGMATLSAIAMNIVRYLNGIVKR